MQTGCGQSMHSRKQYIATYLCVVGQSIQLILGHDPKQIATETISPVLIQEISHGHHIKNII